MSVIRERLKSLRERMKEQGIDAWYVRSSDCHNSEYVSDSFKFREYFSGFTGSAGELLVFKDRAYLWTDGRYFEQAAAELTGSGIELMKSGEKDVPRLEEFVQKELKEGEVLGLNGHFVTTAFAKKLKKAGKEAGFTLSYKKDISAKIMRLPAHMATTARVLDITLSGMGVHEKLHMVRDEMKKLKCEAYLVSRLDDIMWLFNIRGRDIRNNPVLYSYAFITYDKAYLFVRNESLSEELTRYCFEENIVLKDYSKIEGFIKKEPGLPDTLLLDENQVNYCLYKCAKKRFGRIVNAPDPTSALKAVKNPVETGNLRRIYHKDSLALTRFIKEISQAGDLSLWTEYSAAERLADIRRQIPEYIEPSFDTIAAYGANAAMMHYQPSKDREVRLANRGFFLVDSGGQYKGGTTDITRTLVLGDLTEEEKRAFTLVAVSMIRLLNTVFLKGCTGINVDLSARGRLWKEGIDYKCGTGHGVGYMLNVHEGPHGIRWRAEGKQAELKEGMNVTNEPGVYRGGKFGIRTENVMLVVKAFTTEDGEFLRFENLVMVPIDDKGIDRTLMSSEELKEYMAYQRMVYEDLAPDLNEEEREWLRKYSGI